jgi:penicillin-binding protein 1A
VYILSAIWKFIKNNLLSPFRAYWQHQGTEGGKRRPINAKFILKGLAFSFLCFITICFLFYIAVNRGLFGGMPSRTELKLLQNSTASEVYSADSVLIGRYFIQDRTNIPYEAISPDVVKALIATEDARFYSHKGVDSRSLARVLVKSLLMQDESSGGGSTISQQLAKNLYPRRKYWMMSTLINKVREMIIARRLEKVYSKKEILELYLNTVPMGENIYGIERAARRFFNTTADSLRIQEAAVLVGMLKATTSYNPRLESARSR